MVERVGLPHAQPADAARGLEGQVAVHVDVVRVDGRGHRDDVPRQGLDVVERAPVRALGEQAGGAAQRPQVRVELEGGGHDVLAGGQGRVGGVRVEVRVLRQHPRGGPVGRGAAAGQLRGLGVDGLVQHGVERVDVPVVLLGHGRQERLGQARGGAAAVHGLGQDPVQPVHAGVAAQEHAQGLGAGHGEEPAVGQPHGLPGLLGGADQGHRLGPRRAVPGVAGEELVRPVAHPRVGGLVDAVGVAGERGEAAGDQAASQPLGVEGEVGERAEAAEALAEGGPRGGAEGEPDHLGVAHDRGGPQVHEVLGEGLVRGERARGGEGGDGGRGGAPGAALVQ